jgi:hypothetical protein
MLNIPCRCEHDSRLVKKHEMGGWEIHVVAPEGVSRFDIQSLDMTLVETGNTTITWPITIHLASSID